MLLSWRKRGTPSSPSNIQHPHRSIMHVAHVFRRRRDRTPGWSHDIQKMSIPHPDEQYSCAKGCVETAPLLLTHYPSLSLAHGRNNQRTASHMGVLFTVLDAKTLTREISSKCDVMSVPVLGVHCLVG